jgi:hypothetical protein
MTTQNAPIFKFWIRYKVEGLEREMTLVSHKANERAAKKSIKDLYGKKVKVKFLEVLNLGLVK